MTESYIEIYHKDNLEVLKNMKSNSIDLVYIDPPFNTGKIQDRKSLKTIRSNNGDRTGFKGQKYSTKIIGSKSYSDIHENFLDFLKERIIQTKRILKENGSFFLHLDYREIHYA